MDKSVCPEGMSFDVTIVTAGLTIKIDVTVTNLLHRGGPRVGNELITVGQSCD